MERKREATRVLLGEGLKELMKSHPFEKITVKMITDQAGVLRPTFYNHYRDKYELLEGVFLDEVGAQMDRLLADGMSEEAVKLLFLCMERDRGFYRKAFEVTGQNSFEEILEQYLYRFFLACTEKHPLKKQPGIKFWRGEVVAKYYSVGLTGLLKSWLVSEKMEIPAAEVIRGYYILMTHSIFDLIDKKEQT